MDPYADPAPEGQVLGALGTLRYLYPAALFVTYAVASAVSTVRLHSIKAAKEAPAKPAHRRIALGLVTMLTLSYLAQVFVLVLRAVLTNRTIGPDSAVIGWLSAVLVFGVEFSSLQGDEHPVWYIHLSMWLFALGFEVVMMILSLICTGGQFALDVVGGVDVGLTALRVCAIIGLLGTHCAYLYGGKEKATDEETQGLLTGGENGENGEASAYGATERNNKDNGKDKKKKQPRDMSWNKYKREMTEKAQKRLEEDGNLIAYLRRFSIFWPYLWPSNNRRLQLRLVLVGVCMFANNALNMLLPRQIGIIVDNLGTGDLGGKIWTEMLIFVMIRVASSECGVNLLRSWLMIPVRLFTNQSLDIAAYTHIMALSANFHDSTSSSDKMNAMYGGNRLTSIVENLLFTLVPMFVDMVLAFAYLSAILGPYEGFVSVASGVSFVYVASRMLARRGPAVRIYEELWHIQRGIMHNSLDGWQTVSSFNQIQYECDRYENAVNEVTEAKRSVEFGWQTSSAMQSLTLLAGLAASAALAVFRIRDGTATPGQFAVLISYWAQLSQPLRYFVDLGKNTKENFIWCERLLEMMNQKPTIVNKGSQHPLKFKNGEVKFNNVRFSYDKGRDILKNLNFTADGGKTVALVGATGSGKSTILKLVGRFYDVSEGSIQIDGQDIRDVDLYNLRGRIGVVPQETLLFADSIMNNVRYGKLSATDEEVFEACKAACMHDQILTFTDGYDSYVGDRGIKLSGGERQRVAIARAILKDPDIVLLDEATSAVDTETEQKIQSSLRSLCQGRTTFIVAHRLSTVKNADRILVIGDGDVLEDGTHDELLALGGKYRNLWTKQGFVRPLTEGEESMDIHDDIHIDPEEACAEASGSSGKAAEEAKDDQAKDDQAKDNQAKDESTDWASLTTPEKKDRKEDGASKE